MGTKTTVHPEVRSYLVDELASASKPLGTRTLSRTATSALSRFADRAGIDRSELMTWNSGGWYEVTGATVARILDREPGVVMTGIEHEYRGKAKHYALQANIDRWAREREAREVAAVAADTRFVIDEDDFDVRVLDTQSPLASTPMPVAAFSIRSVGRDEALTFAASVKRSLVRRTLGEVA